MRLYVLLFPLAVLTESYISQNGKVDEMIGNMAIVPYPIGVRANIHWGGGGHTEFCPNGERKYCLKPTRFGGGGGSSRILSVNCRHRP